MQAKQLAGCLVVVALVAAGPPVATAADLPEHDMHRQHMQHEQHTAQQAPTDTRPLVQLPEPMRLHMLSNMRDHLLALQQIQDALANERFDAAAQIAEQRLGMTALELHGAHDLAPYMPAPMRKIGSDMHRAASQFAIAAGDAAASGDVKPALAALADLTAQCVACHEGFRVQ